MNTEAFNFFLVEIFALLQRKFPVRELIDLDELVEKYRENGGTEQGDVEQIAEETVTWLNDEGYIRHSQFHYVLTEKGLALLKVRPLEGIDGKTIGDKVREVASDTAKEGRNAAIAAVVGEIISTFMKSIVK